MQRDPLASYWLDGERDQLRAVIADLRDDDRKLSYAAWLQDRDAERAEFVRRYVTAIQSGDPAAFYEAGRYPQAWLNLIGFRLFQANTVRGVAALHEPLMRNARPALGIVDAIEQPDDAIPIGATKYGGRPDLPADVAWPIGDDCKSIYTDSCEGVEAPAGFVAQINLGELAWSEAVRCTPGVGLVSFFCYQNIEDDNPDQIGICARYFPEPSTLVRRESPSGLSEGNRLMPARRWVLEETLDIPEDCAYAPDDGPWVGEFALVSEDARGPLRVHIQRFYEDGTILGYDRATSGDDPTPNRDSRFLLSVDNQAECRLHIQIPAADLARGNFEAVTLNWVDFW